MRGVPQEYHRARVNYGQFTPRNSQRFARCTVPVLQRGGVSISRVAIGAAQVFGRMTLIGKKSWPTSLREPVVME